MALNRECYIKSLKADATVYGKNGLIVIGLIVGGVLGYIATPYAIPLINGFFAWLWSQATAVNCFLLVLLIPIIMQATIVFAMSKEVVKQAHITQTFALGCSALTIIDWLCYNLTSVQPNTIKTCPDFLTELGCNVFYGTTYPQQPYPDMFWVMVILVAYFLISTPFIVAYARCKDG